MSIYTASLVPLNVTISIRPLESISNDSTDIIKQLGTSPPVWPGASDSLLSAPWTPIKLQVSVSWFSGNVLSFTPVLVRIKRCRANRMNCPEFDREATAHISCLLHPALTYEFFDARSTGTLARTAKCMVVDVLFAVVTHC